MKKMPKASKLNQRKHQAITHNCKGHVCLWSHCLRRVCRFFWPLVLPNVTKKTDNTPYFTLLVGFRSIKPRQQQLTTLMNNPMVAVKIILRIHSARSRIHCAWNFWLNVVNILFKSVNTSDINCLLLMLWTVRNMSLWVV
ncbi:MAG: hypothetical protein ACI955_003337 [Zhongshania sp.]|jgi:hypothetical protein